jgi:hypothetical protein
MEKISRLRLEMTTPRFRKRLKPFERLERLERIRSRCGYGCSMPMENIRSKS